MVSPSCTARAGQADTEPGFLHTGDQQKWALCLMVPEGFHPPSSILLLANPGNLAPGDLSQKMYLWQLMVCVSSQLCTHDGNLILVLMESIYNTEIGKCYPSGRSLPRPVVKPFPARRCVYLHLGSFLCYLLQALPLSRSLYLISLKKIYTRWIGPLLHSTWNLLGPLHSLATAAGTCTMQALTTPHVPWALPVPGLHPAVSLMREWGSPSSCMHSLMHWGLGTCGATWTNGEWQSLTMRPSLVSQEDGSEMHFPSLPKNRAFYLCLLLQSIDSQSD